MIRPLSPPIGLQQSIKIGRTQESNHLPGQLCPRRFRQHRRVERLYLKQDRDGALRILREKCMRIRLAIDEAEAFAIAGILAAMRTAADRRRFEVLYSAI